VTLPSSPGHVGFKVNTATGAGFPQVQAFPALAHLDGSAREAVGMYGNTYDLEIAMSASSEARRARVWFTSLATADISRYWDGVGLVDGVAMDIRHVPSSPSTLLADIIVAAGERRTLRFAAMVPGLSSIPQALVIESVPP
jgi:hypothetical protein